MLRELANVLKTTKPRHFLNGFISPYNTLRAFKYHYRRVPENFFIQFILKQYGYPIDTINSYYKDYNKNSSLWEEIKEKLSIYPKSRGCQMSRELPSLYLIARIVKPNFIVETGVASGASSAYILKALHDNKKGYLYSIDLPPDNLPFGKKSGWIVPQTLKDRWSLHLGDSKDLLKPLLSEIGKIDCFFHDSLHTYEHMIWEFKTAWRHLRPGGLFLSHDVGANNAFFDFMKEKGVSWNNYRVFHVLGAFKRFS